MAYIVKVPKPSRAAYNPNRSLEKNCLVKAQVKHFHEAEKQLPEHLKTGIDVHKIMTEGEAADYIARVTEALHKQGGRPPQKVRKAT